VPAWFLCTPASAGFFSLQSKMFNGVVSLCTKSDVLNLTRCRPNGT